MAVVDVGTVAPVRALQVTVVVVVVAPVRTLQVTVVVVVGAVAPIRALQVIVVVVMVVARVVCLLSIGHQFPEGNVHSIGPLGLAIVALTVHLSTKPGPGYRLLCPASDNPQTLPPIFSHQKGWPLITAPS